MKCCCTESDSNTLGARRVCNNQSKLPPPTQNFFRFYHFSLLWFNRRLVLFLVFWHLQPSLLLADDNIVVISTPHQRHEREPKISHWRLFAISAKFRLEIDVKILVLLRKRWLVELVLQSKNCKFKIGTWTNSSG